MTLAGRFRSEFGSDIQIIGGERFRERAVHIIDHSVMHVEAVVHAAADYLVRLTLDRSTFKVACTCATFERDGVCADIWATILESDRKHYLTNADLFKKQKFTYDLDAYGELLEIEQSQFRETEPERVVESLNNNVPQILPKAPPKPISKPISKPSPDIEPLWKKQLAVLTNAVSKDVVKESSKWPSGREIFYVIDAATTASSGKLTIEVAFRERTKKGEWGKLKTQRIAISHIPTMRDENDRQILGLLAGARDNYGGGGSYYNYSYSYGYDSIPFRCQLTTELQSLVLPLMCSTGRCRVRRFEKDEELPVVTWDEGGPWKFWLASELADGQYVFKGLLRRGGDEFQISQTNLIVDGLTIDRDFRLSRLDVTCAPAWIRVLKNIGQLKIPVENADELLEQLLAIPGSPSFELPEELRFSEVTIAPRPRVVIKRSEYKYSDHSRLDAFLFFEYGHLSIESTDVRKGIYDRAERRFILRDMEVEQQSEARLKSLGFKTIRGYYDSRWKLELTPANLPRAVKALLNEGWQVEAEGKLYRNPGSMSFAVSSGIDWFELHGKVDFGEGLHASLPALLTAVKRGEGMVRLGDGSFGLLPEEWLKNYGALASLGESTDDHLRFKQTQTGLLDALLAAQPESSADEVFARVRGEWRNFKGIEAVQPPESFVGSLREYQMEGLGWFGFLQRFGFGGCLADDMGLGKTVQVLALLESRRVERELKEAEHANGSPKKRGRKPAAATATNNSNGLPRPSLVVVPRSLIFNWKAEAQKFTPQLSILTHTGIERTKASEHFKDYDLVLTTYGTLRRDALHFNDAEFDFVILDEAQAIKNSRTESAKAARLLKGKHRLALSGTPIENHLGELWSLFEFLNPGMLGAASVFQMTGNAARLPDDETKKLLSRALAPFILRRTKQQVAKDLPEKLEQTIYCEMEPVQQKLYDELRAYYRQSLTERVAKVGVNRAKIHILEALLRLRQAACHPALVTKSKGDEPSAKLEVLIPQLVEVSEEGHKALVFSQFTSFLSIVRKRLDKEGIVYEYLDGKTVDRASKVNRFQNDPDCKLFLISLKAGGQGLNLTAAEYVFLLDPWWNPAVEAQAIDRAHRIGQSQRVFAYRLITRNTVEEKVLALQSTKRDLADAIIGANENLIRNITKDDLMLLLS